MLFGLDIQTTRKTIEQFSRDNQGIINVLVGLAALVTIATLAWAIWQGIRWYKTKIRKLTIPPSTFPFEVIKPHGNVLSLAFGAHNNDPLADERIPYQGRGVERNIRRELEKKLEQRNWLLIVGRTGLGKTREAAELAQLYNREGWTVLWLKLAEWVDEPTQEQLDKIGTNRKLLFFLDNLNQRMHYRHYDVFPKVETSELAPAIIPLQERLRRTLEAYERLYSQAEMRVIATARNERQSLNPGEPSEWEKLQWEKYPQLWQRFEVYELPAPEDEAIVQLLRDIVPQVQISAREENYGAIARENDSTFRNVVENLRHLKNRRLPLTPNNYQNTLTENWINRYQNAVRRYPAAKYIYDAVDLLQQFGISLERFTVEPTALLMVQGNFWQWLWYRWSILRALNNLIEAERILSPRDGQIEAKGRWVEVGKYVRPLSHKVLKLTDKYPQKMLSSLFNFGRQLSILNHPKEALACFNKIISFVPQIEISEFWGIRGEVLYKLRRYEDAIASYDEALELQPNDALTWYNRGVALGKLGRYEDAIDSYNKALELRPNLFWIRSNRGVALDELGRYEDAIASYDEALELQPNDALTWYNRGVALDRLERYEDAVVSYNKTLELSPHDRLAWYNRGVALDKLGCYVDAIASYDKVLELKLDHYKAWSNRGAALNALGHYVDALASYDEALKLQPDDYQAWSNRGLALNKLGRYEDALACYNQALKLQPDDYQAWYNKACCYALQKNVNLAVENLERAISFNPKCREVAKTDSDFGSIREDEQFQKLIQGRSD
jgi:tetratricopeptide (TPR) repeat protein